MLARKTRRKWRQEKEINWEEKVGREVGKRKEELQWGRLGNGVGGKVGKRQGRKEEKIEGKGGQRGGKRKEELQERGNGVGGKLGKRPGKKGEKAGNGRKR
jgi:hypothetical protein